MKRKALLWIISISLACALILGGASLNGMKAPVALAEAVAGPAADPSPAVYVSRKNADSVVGVITNTQQWNRNTGEVDEAPYAQGSGVVIAEGGYILTNCHVVEGGDSYQILMPSGEKADAHLAGSDPALDLAVLQVDPSFADQLVPVTVGSSADLIVGSTVIAIGNPGGEVLANTVTQGIVSALERSDVSSDNTTRNVDYIQHDAAINSGNSGGGLFNYKGELVGINTLKYAGSTYSTVQFEGLGFAIPIDTAYPIAKQLIEKGEIVRPQMGISVADYEGPNEPASNFPPASVCIYGVNEGSPAETAGLKLYDFIYSINDERVTCFRELSTIMDKFEAGDTVSVTVVRYASATPVTRQQNSNNYYYNNPFGGFFGNFGGYDFGSGNDYSNNNTAVDETPELTVGGGFEFVTVDVTLELPEDKN